MTMQYILYSNRYALKYYTLKIRGDRIQLDQGRPFRMYGPCNQSTNKNNNPNKNSGS